MLTVAAYTGGVSVPSARYRVRQLIGPLRHRHVQVREFPAVFGSYPPDAGWQRPFWGGLALGERALAAVRGRPADVTLLQREMLSTLLTAERLTRRPRVLDVDDAIWLVGPRAARTLAGACELVVCGNRYLQEHFAVWNANTLVVPTAVDTGRFTPGPTAAPPPSMTIGWSGTSGGHRYLASIEPALRRVLDAEPTARLRIISDRRPVLSSLREAQVEFVRWSPQNEVSSLQDLAIGIMPLDDTPWSRGKCAFKMLTYMACGVPVVASNVGMNADVFSQGECGIPVMTGSEWADALVSLLRAPASRARAGHEGRRIVEAAYSTERVADTMATALLAVGR